MVSPHGSTTVSEQLSVHTAIINGTMCDVQQLIKLARALPEEVVPIDIFAEQKTKRCWTDAARQRLGPSNILRLAAKYDGNWQAMLFANLDWAQHTMSVRNALYGCYPLLVLGDCEVIDGMHRLTRAWIDRAKVIAIKRFPELPTEAVLTRKPRSSV